MADEQKPGRTTSVAPWLSAGGSILAVGGAVTLTRWAAEWTGSRPAAWFAMILAGLGTTSILEAVYRAKRKQCCEDIRDAMGSDHPDFGSVVTEQCAKWIWNPFLRLPIAAPGSPNGFNDLCAVGGGRLSRRSAG
jgi:hypothetical protein